MHLTGMSLAALPRMNDRYPLPAPCARLLDIADAPPTRDDEIGPADADGDELDKYDPSTLACTD
jgi:hypothetical protein